MHQRVRRKGVCIRSSSGVSGLWLLTRGREVHLFHRSPGECSLRGRRKATHSSMREFQGSSGPTLLYFTTEEQWKTRSNP